jgi:hypothetical protein
MAEIIGYLKEDATSGEKRVLKALATALPRDFSVYVECPLHDDDMERMPDFIVLTNFGVVVLEVKDWVNIVEADKYYAKIHARSGKVHQQRNPVGAAREFAYILAQKLQQVPQLLGERHKLKIPWGYAVVLPNVGAARLTQLRKPWGTRQVLGMDDLKPHLVVKRLRATLPSHRHYDLRREDLRYVRSVINPVVFIAPEQTRRGVVMDEVQERIATEPPRIPARPEGSKSPAVEARQADLFAPAGPESLLAEQPEERPPELDAVLMDLSIRLVRGVAGSGKTLVLTQRARYLAAQHPNWRLLVLTYNNRLMGSLQASLKGIPNVKVTNFHSLCTFLLKDHIEWHSPCDSEGWINRHSKEWPIVAELGAEFICDEIKWIKDVGITSRAAYMEADRKGRGQALRRGGRHRERIYELLKAYDAWLHKAGTYDWTDVPWLVLKHIESGAILPGQWDAVLVDEAQDFAPSWVRVVRRLVKPEGGLIFMTDDPSQSIYRYFSWREKGIPVVGRTRWLTVPYRNTREIYQAAYEVIRGDDVLKQQLEEQLGQGLVPDLASPYLRNGERPQIRQFACPEDELAFIRTEIEWLLQKGYDSRQMVVLHRRSAGVRKLEHALRGTGVEVATFHALKGLEYEIAFLSQMQETFPRSAERSEQALSEERRLVYMAMTRAREKLYMGYVGRWPAQLEGVRRYAEQAYA